MRSIAEIDADIAEVQARLAKRDEGMPQRSTPEYRAARFDYIVDGTRTGLDAYQSALNAAIQNKLSRESAEYIAAIKKGEAALEKKDEIVKNLSDTSAIIDDLKKRNYADDSVEMRKAQNLMDYWVSRAARKGMDISAYKGEPNAAPAASNTPAPAQTNAAPVARTFENVASDIAQLGTDSTATMDRVAELRKELEQHKSKVSYDKIDPLVNQLNEKETSINDKKQKDLNDRFEKWKSDTDTYLGEKDWGKRSKLLQGQRDSSEEFKDLKDYEKYNQKIEKGMKKPVPDPLTKGVVRQNFGKNDVITMMKELKAAKEKGITKNVSVGDKGRTVTFKLLKNGDVQVLNEKGKEIDLFKKADLEEFDMGNKVTVKPQQADIPIVKALKGESKFPNGRIIVGPGEDW